MNHYASDRKIKKRGNIAAARNFFEIERPTSLLSVGRLVSPADYEHVSNKILHDTIGSEVKIFDTLFVEVFGGKRVRKLYSELALSDQSEIKTFDAFNARLGKVCITSMSDADDSSVSFEKLDILRKKRPRKKDLFVVFANMQHENGSINEFESIRKEVFDGISEGVADFYDYGSDYAPRLHFGFSHSFNDAVKFVKACNKDEEFLGHKYLLGIPEPIQTSSSS
jgi:hypothetical protein